MRSYLTVFIVALLAGLVLTPGAARLGRLIWIVETSPIGARPATKWASITASSCRRVRSR